MKTRILFFILTAANGCSHENNQVILCSERCSDSAPWKVESLDRNLPCFETEKACENWRESHGYSGKPCVKCN